MSSAFRSAMRSFRATIAVSMTGWTRACPFLRRRYLADVAGMRLGSAAGQVAGFRMDGGDAERVAGLTPPEASPTKAPARYKRLAERVTLGGDAESRRNQAAPNREGPDWPAQASAPAGCESR